MEAHVLKQAEAMQYGVANPATSTHTVRRQKDGGLELRPALTRAYCDFVAFGAHNPTFLIVGIVYSGGQPSSGRHAISLLLQPEDRVLVATSEPSERQVAALTIAQIRTVSISARTVPICFPRYVFLPDPSVLCASFSFLYLPFSHLYLALQFHRARQRPVQNPVASLHLSFLLLSL